MKGSKSANDGLLLAQTAALKLIQEADSVSHLFLQNLSPMQQAVLQEKNNGVLSGPLDSLYNELGLLLKEMPFQIREVKCLALQRERSVKKKLSPFLRQEIEKSREKTLSEVWKKFNFQEIDIPLADLEIFQQLNNLMHTEEKGWQDLKLTCENVVDFLEFANSWQIESLKEHCEDFLSENLESLDQEVDWMEVCDDYNLLFLKIFLK